MAEDSMNALFRYEWAKRLNILFHYSNTIVHDIFKYVDWSTMNVHSEQKKIKNISQYNCCTKMQQYLLWIATKCFV